MIYKFRGLQKNAREWVYGTGILEDGHNTWIISNQLNKPIAFGQISSIVLPETVGQYTGLKDKNGVDSFDSDLCEYSYDIDCDVSCGIETILLMIRWCGSDFRWAFYDALNGDFYCNLADLKPEDFEVIGNIHEKPELLEAKA